MHYPLATLALVAKVQKWISHRGWVGEIKTKTKPTNGAFDSNVR